MKVFLDTEFTSLTMYSSLLSLALVSEDGREFYAEIYPFDKKVSKWVKENVLDNFLYKNYTDYFKLTKHNDKGTEYSYHCNGFDYEIVDELAKWLKQFDEIEIWSDCLAYDWVLFCDLFGGAEKIPKNINYIPFDIATLFKIKGINPDITREDFILDIKIQGVKHNALYDAKVIKACYDKLMKL